MAEFSFSDYNRAIEIAPNEATRRQLVAARDKAFPVDDTPAVPKDESTFLGAPGAFVRGMGSGLSFNLNDEFGGAVQGLYDWATTDKPLGQAYIDRRDAIRGQRSQDYQSAPLAAIAGDAVGATASGLVIPASPLLKGATLPKDMAIQGASAAAEGALAGYGASEGGDVVADTLQGGAFGGALGVAAAPIARGAGRLLSGETSPQRASRAAIETALDEDAINPRGVQAYLSQEGIPAEMRPADVSPALREEFATSMQSGGKQVRAATDFMQERTANTGGRLSGAVRQATGTGDINPMEWYQETLTRRAERAKPLYDAVRDVEVPGELLDDFWSGFTDVERKALTQQADTYVRKSRGEYKPGTIGYYDQVKRALDVQIADAKKNKTGYDVGLLSKEKRRLTDALNQVDGRYAEARQIYTDESGMKDAFDLGIDIPFESGARSTPGKLRDTVKQYQSMPGSEQEAFRIGLVQNFEDFISRNKKNHASLISWSERPGSMDLMREVLPPERYSVFETYVAAEKAMRETAAESVGGSQTAGRVARRKEQQSLASALGPDVAQVAIRPGSPDLWSRIASRAGDIRTTLKQRAQNNESARVLMLVEDLGQQLEALRQSEQAAARAIRKIPEAGIKSAIPAAGRAFMSAPEDDRPALSGE